jgi:L-asparaginase / beta-aspartyl-peptidase
MNDSCPITLAVHGGAGALPAGLRRGAEAARRADLTAALLAGHEVLAASGTALDAVVAAVRVLEDSPRFNAGRGAVFTRDGTHELDAAVMDGASGKAGAVAAVSRLRNPVAAALLVMRRSPYVLLCGGGAERFAAAQGADVVDAGYFYDAERRAQLDRARTRGRVELDHDGGTAPRDDAPDDGHYGTVGAVALDRAGNLAAATSTGGLTNRHAGRIGDTPVIGAGTYADNASVAVSATGVGEVFLRTVAAHDIAALVRYRALTVQQAAEEVILGKIRAAGGRGGALVLDARGNLAMVFNTAAMYRGVVGVDGVARVGIRPDDDRLPRRSSS